MSVKAEDNITMKSDKPVYDIASNTDQYFWHTETGTDTGAHITEIPKEEFLEDPANGGGNLLSRSTGIAVRDGLTELARFASTGVQMGQDSDTHVVVTKRGLKMFEDDTAGGIPYVWLSDLRNDDGLFETEDFFTRSSGNGRTALNQTLSLNFAAVNNTEKIKVGNEVITRETFSFLSGYDSQTTPTRATVNYIRFNQVPEAGQTCVVSYRDEKDGLDKTATFTTDGTSSKYNYATIETQYYSQADIYHVTLDGNEVFGVTWYNNSSSIKLHGLYIPQGTSFSVEYSTNSVYTKAYTLGRRATGSATGAMSFVTGINNEASSSYAVATGHNTKATGLRSFAEGYSTEASGSQCHAEGSYTEASGSECHAEGYHSKASGAYSHAEGDHCEASGYASHAGGYHTIASGLYQTAIGEYNVEHPFVPGSGQDVVYFIVGCGDASTRKDALTVTENTLAIKGTLSQGSDRRLKEHIDYLNEDAIDFIRKLKPAHYIKDEKHHVGFYAQDVQEVDKWDCMTGEMNGYMTLGYTELIAPLVAYCQHLEERIRKLEEK